MSFSFEFHAISADEAKNIVDQEYAPDCVKEFISIALDGIKGSPVYVKAQGHLCNNDYNISTASITVQPVTLRVAKKES